MSAPRNDIRCSRCRDHLFYETEIDTGICGSCADAMYERSQERREFDYYHPAGDEAQHD